MKEYPRDVTCAGRTLKCAWLFKMNDGSFAATYVSPTTRECLNTKWSGDDLEVFESSGEFTGQPIKF